MRQPPRLNTYRWQRAVVLAHLVRQDEPVTMITLGDALGVDHTTLYAHLRQLDHMGCVQRFEHTAAGKAGPRFLYAATPAVMLVIGPGVGRPLGILHGATHGV